MNYLGDPEFMSHGVYRYVQAISLKTIHIKKCKISIMNKSKCDKMYVLQH